MKKLLMIFVVMLLAKLTTSTVLANEGTLLLTGNPGNGACFVSSIYIEGNYRVMASCRDLRSAMTPEKSVYVLWAIDEKGGLRRMGAISYGKYMGAIDRKFSSMQVTIEVDAYVSKPSDVVLTGGIKSLDFGANLSSGVQVITPTPTPTVVNSDIKVENKTQTTATKSTLSGAVSVVFRIALLGFVILLVVVGIFSYLSRRRSL